MNLTFLTITKATRLKRYIRSHHRTDSPSPDPAHGRKPVSVLVPFQPASYHCLSLDCALLADSDGGSSGDYLLSTNDFDPGGAFFGQTMTGNELHGQFIEG